MVNEKTENTARSVPVIQMRKTRGTECRTPCRTECEEENREGLCPYFLRDRGKGVIYCECAHFRFPDMLARREYVYTFCAHPTGYKQCPIKRAMDHFYDRKFSKPGEGSESGEGK